MVGGDEGRGGGGGGDRAGGGKWKIENRERGEREGRRRGAGAGERARRRKYTQKSGEGSRITAKENRPELQKAQNMTKEKGGNPFRYEAETCTYIRDCVLDKLAVKKRLLENLRETQ